MDLGLTSAVRMIPLLEGRVIFQAASMSPMLGQAHHFREYAKEKLLYAIDRFTSEAGRLYRVMEKRLSEREYLGGHYTIADIAAYPWLRSHTFQGQKLEDYPPDSTLV
jgi:GST-like protein